MNVRNRIPLSRKLRARLGSVIQKGRRVAESGAAEALAMLAVGEARPHDHMSLGERALRDALRARGLQAGDRMVSSSNAQETSHLAHEAAYEHWHRMLFARFLAENELLIPPEYGVSVSLDDCRELAREEGRDPWALAGGWAQAMLPGIFAPDDPVLELALPPETSQKLEELLESLPSEIFTAQDSLGWTYQHWRSEEKNRVSKASRKIGANELPAVTQLFTERYMVLFLLHNTVGAWWAGKVLGDDPLPASAATDEASLRERVRLRDGGGYDFSYLRFTRTKANSSERGERTGPWRPAAGAFPDWPKVARDLRILDPCCGSGHFLVEAFELLVRLRMEEEGLEATDAVRAVLRENLFGLEIDPRCTQIAAFNLALAAWRLAGRWVELPPLHVACCGIAPEGTEGDWTRLADELERLPRMADYPDLFGPDASRTPGRYSNGMARLRRLFGQARELGSLLDPQGVRGDPHHAGYDELKKLLDIAIERERKAVGRDERAVAAAGITQAARMLTGRYTLVVTNVPFLTRKKQSTQLRNFAEGQYDEAKGDIATVFVSRIFRWLGNCGTQALVTPQSWLFLTTYRKLRKRLLSRRTWNLIARLGTKAFDTPMWDFNVMLVVLSAGNPEPDWEMAGVDVSSPWGQPPIRVAEKARLLESGSEVIESVQADQLENPDVVVLMQPLGDRSLLQQFAHGFRGISTVDYPAFGRLFWEVVPDDGPWTLQQSTLKETTDYGGREHVVYWDSATSETIEKSHLAVAKQYQLRGRMIWGRGGIAVSQIGSLPVTFYTGEKFDDNTAILGSFPTDHFAAVWTFCASPEYAACVREFDQGLKVTSAALVNVPFDLDHWSKVAAERYPNGLPEPYSDDPTQWIFHGDPCRSVIWDKDSKLTAQGPTRFDGTVLQIAVGRLLGYRWPAELDPEMRLAPEQRAVVDHCAAYNDLADDDGIVCLSPARGEVSAADRLRSLLVRAYGDEWSADTERRLLAATNPKGRPPKSLELWLRDKFFAEHCKLFHNRPFVWHIWDGRKDGFHALVNYHRLSGPYGEGRRTLESLAYAYLNDWIQQQRFGRSEDVPGADARLAHAIDLQQQLERILTGEPPCDLFVRWKPLHAQAIGWAPDLDDGVRLNIRPFMRAGLRKGGRVGAGILRVKPNVKWAKDRGKEPEEPRPRGEFPWFWGCPGTGSAAERTNFKAAAGAKFDGNRWNDLHYTLAAKRRARERVPAMLRELDAWRQ